MRSQTPGSTAESGQPRRFCDVRVTSACPPRAAVRGTSWYFVFVPRADSHRNKTDLYSVTSSARSSSSDLREAGLVEESKGGMLGIARLLFDQQQPALLVAVEGIYGSEQARALDQPWLVVRIDVKDEHKVLRFEIAADRRMMSDASPEYSLAAEVHDVASARIVGAAQMLPKLLFAEIAQEGDFPARIGPSDIGQFVQRKAKDAHGCRAPARAGKYLALCACRLPQRPIRVGNGGRPTARPI
jgi:hypothetical protein